MMTILTYFLLIFLIPATVVYFGVHTAVHNSGGNSLSFELRSEIFKKFGKPPYKIKSYIVAKDTVQEFELENYLVGVVAAEMPASFPEEALKAQAVVARTYIVSRTLADKGDVAEHKGAPICTNPAHCNAWKSTEDARTGWGNVADEYLAKVTKAVNDTKGQIILYNGKPISAVYYAMSGGSTENAADVWGGNVPYLKSVSSSFDKNAPNFSTTAEFTFDEFRNIITGENAKANLSGNPNSWIGAVSTSQGGGVTSIVIGGQAFKGTRLRTLFSLRSQNFTVEITDRVIFHVKGYGHGVGMSQWGCKFLAEGGKNYEEILKYYYTGVEIGAMPG
ncbi:MAG: stage II sporulation protein D [Bacillota bacterium]|nr:stage II sporulation protein D [Bacillota bacterium]